LRRKTREFQAYLHRKTGVFSEYLRYKTTRKRHITGRVEDENKHTKDVFVAFLQRDEA